MLLLVVSLSLCWTMSTRAKNSRSHGYLYDMLSMIFWFVWGEDTGVVTRLDIYHLAAAAGSWRYWHCDCDQDQDQEDHYYWDFVNTSSSSEIAPQMTPAGPIRYTQHHTWPVLIQIAGSQYMVIYLFSVYIYRVDQKKVGSQKQWP